MLWAMLRQHNHRAVGALSGPRSSVGWSPVSRAPRVPRAEPGQRLQPLDLLYECTPDYCRDAAQAVDLVMRDLQKLVSYPIIGPKVGKVVGTTGIEPVTPSMSRKCSPAELSARKPNA